MLPYKTTHNALGLYGILLVLPTLVFGWLYWRELKRDYDDQLAVVPEDAQDGARRILQGMQGKLDEFLGTENARPFFHYGEIFPSGDVVGDPFALQDSPLVRDGLPRGILGWFSFDILEDQDRPIEIFTGNADPRGIREAGLRTVLHEFRLNKRYEGLRERLRELDGMASTSVPMWAVAINRSHDEDLECLEACGESIQDRNLKINVSEMHLEFYFDEQGEPRAIASRQVTLFPQEDSLPEDADCLQSLLLDGFGVRQGFVLDVGWLFGYLPQHIASQVLSENEELKEPSTKMPIQNVGSVFAELRPVRDLGFSVADAQDKMYGRLEVEINTDRIKERFESQSKRFLLVAGMLVLTLAIGITLLYRSVNIELEQAHRMQNFVAAVTHELRTPVSTIRLHGEMLLDGWASDEDKRQEYYARIVRETDRLSTLVENVLEKSRLKESRVEPEVGDLNEVIERLKPRLRPAAGERDDLRFELEPDAPLVLLTDEGVTGILTNLVENARKYAPPGADGEPVVVRTRTAGRRVILEVADRGPGVPPTEKDKIFQAFYRVGSESTRTAPGTGLGLHLVSLHAEAVGAEVSLQARDGGGSVFQVAFLIAS